MPPNVVISVTRNGRGKAWRHDSVAQARLHPLIQYGDPILLSAHDVEKCWGPHQGSELANIVPEAIRDRVEDAWSAWKKTRGTRQDVHDAATAIWNHWITMAKKPPEDPVEIVRLISEDRRAIEDQTLIWRYPPESSRLTSGSIHTPQESTMSEEQMTETETKKKRTRAPKEPKEPAAERAPRAERLPDNAVIRLASNTEGVQYGPNNNPKRAGSLAGERFARYRDGMTVGEAKAAKLTTEDFRYDSDHNYIRIEVPEAQQSAAA